MTSDTLVRDTMHRRSPCQPTSPSPPTSPLRRRRRRLPNLLFPPPTSQHRRHYSNNDASDSFSALRLDVQVNPALPLPHDANTQAVELVFWNDYPLNPVRPVSIHFGPGDSEVRVAKRPLGEDYCVPSAPNYLAEAWGCVRLYPEGEGEDGEEEEDEDGWDEESDEQSEMRRRRSRDNNRRGRREETVSTWALVRIFLEAVLLSHILFNWRYGDGRSHEQGPVELKPLPVMQELIELSQDYADIPGSIIPILLGTDTEEPRTNTDMNGGKQWKAYTSDEAAPPPRPLLPLVPVLEGAERAGQSIAKALKACYELPLDPDAATGPAAEQQQKLRSLRSRMHNAEILLHEAARLVPECVVDVSRHIWPIQGVLRYLWHRLDEVSRAATQPGSSSGRIRHDDGDENDMEASSNASAAAAVHALRKSGVGTMLDCSKETGDKLDALVGKLRKAAGLLDGLRVELEAAIGPEKGGGSEGQARGRAWWLRRGKPTSRQPAEEQINVARRELKSWKTKIGNVGIAVRDLSKGLKRFRMLVSEIEKLEQKIEDLQWGRGWVVPGSRNGEKHVRYYVPPLEDWVADIEPVLIKTVAISQGVEELVSRGWDRDSELRGREKPLWYEEAVEKLRVSRERDGVTWLWEWITNRREDDYLNAPETSEEREARERIQEKLRMRFADAFGPADDSEPDGQEDST